MDGGGYTMAVCWCRAEGGGEGIVPMTTTWPRPLSPSMRVSNCDTTRRSTYTQHTPHPTKRDR